MDAGQLRLAEDHEVVRQTQEVRLHGFGVGRARPSLGLPQLVLQFVKGLFDLPAQPVKMRDDARRQGAFAGQKAKRLVA